MRNVPLRGIRWAAAVLLTGVGSAYAVDSPHPVLPAGTPSAACLQCHDGLIASNINPLLPPAAGASSATARGGDHPVGVNYLAAQASRWSTLRPASFLPPEIRLVDGRVECSSCHDLSTGGRPRLALAMAKSGLCFACHNL